MASSLDEMLESRRQIAAKMLAEQEEASAETAAASAGKTKRVVSTGGQVLGGLIGAYFGNPVLGASIGKMAGDTTGDMLTTEKQKVAMKKGKKIDEEEDPIASLIASLSKYGSLMGGSKDGIYEGESDILNERI